MHDDSRASCMVLPRLDKRVQAGGMSYTHYSALLRSYPPGTMTNNTAASMTRTRSAPRIVEILCAWLKQSVILKVALRYGTLF